MLIISLTAQMECSIFQIALMNLIIFPPPMLLSRQQLILKVNWGQVKHLMYKNIRCFSAASKTEHFTTSLLQDGCESTSTKDLKTPCIHLLITFVPQLKCQNILKTSHKQQLYWGHCRKKLYKHFKHQHFQKQSFMSCQ